jgi:hypothetical protein
MPEGNASWEMRNDHRMGGIMSESNRPPEHSNDQPQVPDSTPRPDPDEEPIPGLKAGYQLQEVPTRSHPDHVRSFERARPC